MRFFSEVMNGTISKPDAVDEIRSDAFKVIFKSEASKEVSVFRTVLEIVS